MESPLRKHDSICKTENQLDEDAQNIALCYIHSSQIFPQIEEVWESISPSNIYRESQKQLISLRFHEIGDKTANSRYMRFF